MRLGPWVALVLSWLVLLVFYLLLQRGTTFAVDENDWLTRSATQSLTQMLEPSNGHLTVLPLLLFKACLVLFGVGRLGFTLLEIVALLTLSAGIYVFARDRVGPALALAPAIVPFFVGVGWTTLSVPMIGLQWALTMALGLWALVAVERRTRAGDLAAATLLAGALASFSVAFGFVAAVGLTILLGPGRLRRLWVIVLPLGMYVAWRIWANRFAPTPLDTGNLGWVPPYVSDCLTAAIAALGGMGLSYGPGTSLKLEGYSPHRLELALALAALQVLVLAVALVFRRRTPGLRRVLPIAAIPLVTWCAQAVNLDPLRRPVEPRYMFAAVLVLTLLGVELLRGRTLTWVWALAAASLTAIVVLFNLNDFRSGRELMVAYSAEARADMTALEWAGDLADPSYILSSEPPVTTQTRFIFLRTDRYLELVRRYGSPGLTYTELLRQPEGIREAADAVLARSLRLRIDPRDGLRSSTACRKPLGRLPGGAGRLESGTVVLEALRPTELLVGRFADRATVRVGQLPARTPVAIWLPQGAGARAWSVATTVPTPLSVCRRVA